MSKYRLKFLFQEFDLTSGGFLIGRSLSCNLTLEDPLVSRRHARIVISNENAFLDDLGSRNGTLVNGEPVFEDYRLQHSDKIRIGSHDLTFIEEKHRVRTVAKNTKPLVACPHCDTPVAPDSSRCNVCGTVLASENLCMHCRTPAVDDAALYCTRCGAPLGHDDPTIPVELGGDPSKWNADIINDVIEKALSVRRYEQAARLLDGQMNAFSRSCLRGQLDEKKLMLLSDFNVRVAGGLRDGRRLRWVLKYFCQFGVLMPEKLFVDLDSAAKGWFDIRSDMENYLAIMRVETEDRPEVEKPLNHLDGLLKAGDGKHE